jgi:hypothetical protein
VRAAGGLPADPGSALSRQHPPITSFPGAEIGNDLVLVGIFVKHILPRSTQITVGPCPPREFAK